MNRNDDLNKTSTDDSDNKQGHDVVAKSNKCRTKANAPQSATDSATVDSLNNIADAEQNAKINELINDLQRTRADFENFRRQVDVQKEQYGNAVKYATIKKLLPILDDIDRAIMANPESLGPLEKNLAKSTKELNLEKIATAPGDAFNPDLHDAVMVEGDGNEEVIGEVLRPGYYYENNVIRPAMVKVAKR